MVSQCCPAQIEDDGTPYMKEYKHWHGSTTKLIFHLGKSMIRGLRLTQFLV